MIINKLNTGISFEYSIKTSQHNELYFKSIFHAYLEKEMAIMLLLGISCGLPICLLGSSLTVWLKQEGISYTTIGLFGLATIPSSIKFIWAPIIDHVKIPWLTSKLGHKRSWLIVSQISLLLSLLLISESSPSNHIYHTFIFVIIASITASTQHIVVLAYQVTYLQRSQYGYGEAMCILGARISILISGAGALYLSNILSWGTIYKIIPLCIIVGITATLWSKEPKTPSCYSDNKVNTLKIRTLNYFIFPLKNFLSNQGWKIAIILMLFYRINDNLIMHMSNLFYLDIGFSKQNIANATKIFGMFSMIIGGLIGGHMVRYLGIKNSLIINSLVHGLSLIGFIIIEHYGANTKLLYLTVSIENITSGMLITAFFSLQMSLVNPTYAATQFALLTSIAHLGKNLTSSISGSLIFHLGWKSFLYIGIITTFISVALAVIFKKHHSSFKVS